MVLSPFAQSVAADSDVGRLLLEACSDAQQGVSLFARGADGQLVAHAARGKELVLERVGRKRVEARRAEVWPLNAHGGA